MKKIIIIGGGIAGLSAGIFAQLNGFETEILEKHHTIGGECTGWDRNGYHIDGCIHWLVGTKEGTALRKLWDRVGALDGVKIYHPESFMAVEYEEETVHFYRDLDLLKNSWIEISPDDKGAIEEFCNDIKKLHTFEVPSGKPLDLMNIMEKAKFFFSMRNVGPVINKYNKITIGELADRFEDPALKHAIGTFMPEGNYSALPIVFALGTFTGGQSSIPIGGSKKLALRMQDRYLKLGGTIKTSTEVKKLEIENGQVKQVRTKNGELFSGDYFIAACDAKVLYEGLLNGDYPDPEFEKRFNNPEDYPLASNIYVGIGYHDEIKDIPRTLKFNVDELGIKQNNKPVEFLQMTHYNYEPDFAPEGNTVITFAINQYEPELEKWESLAKDKEAYNQEKNKIGVAIISAMENRFPDMKDKLEVLDVATPQTYQRYCNAYKGAFMGFWPTIQGKELNHTGNINGLDNTWLSGQWLQPPGGLPTALITGKDTIMRICKQEKLDFKV